MYFKGLFIVCALISIVIASPQRRACEEYCDYEYGNGQDQRRYDCYNSCAAKYLK